MIEDESLDEASIDVGKVLHLHKLDHVEVDRLIGDLLLPLDLGLLLSLDRALLPNLVDDADLAHGKDRIDETLGEALGEALVQLGSEGGVGDVDEDLVGRVVVGKRDAERVEEGGEAVLGNLDTVGEDARVDSLGGVSLSLLEELACVATSAEHSVGARARTHRRGERHWWFHHPSSRPARLLFGRSKRRWGSAKRR